MTQNRISIVDVEADPELDEYPGPEPGIPDTSCQACGSPDCGGCYSDADPGL